MLSSFSYFSCTPLIFFFFLPINGNLVRLTGYINIFFTYPILFRMQQFLLRYPQCRVYEIMMDLT